MADRPTFIINKGYDDEEEVVGADTYYTTPDGKFVDFVRQFNGVQILRIAAQRIITIHRQEA